MQKQGAYIVYLYSNRALTLEVGALKNVFLPSGLYAYVGSARGSLMGRIARHARLAESKTGKIHWHIDYLLTHPEIQLTRIALFPGSRECALSQKMAAKPGVTVPVPNFGSTDCRAGCPAHLYHLGSLKRRTITGFGPEYEFSGDPACYARRACSRAGNRPPPRHACVALKTPARMRYGKSKISLVESS